MRLIASIWLGILLCGGMSCLAQDTPPDATNSVATDSDEPTNAPEKLDKMFTNSVGMELVQISGGVWAGVYEVTQKQYRKVAGSNPSAATGDSLPVNNLTFDEASAFCDKMTALDTKKFKIPKGYHYTLPTEDEWVGLVGDATLDNAVCSINGQHVNSPQPVGSTKPNNLGLYDVRGNVMEFVITDPSKPYHVLKGGSYEDHVDINLRPEFRFYAKPDDRKPTFGMRCLLKK